MVLQPPLSLTYADSDQLNMSVSFVFPITVTGAPRLALQLGSNTVYADYLSGAEVISVSGSGRYFGVTVATGMGSGTLGLRVIGSASIFDLDGDVLGKGYAGGEVYTMRKAPIGEIDDYYADGHADYLPVYENGEFSMVLEADPGVLPNSGYPSAEVSTYLGAASVVTLPDGKDFDFLGAPAGASLYVSSSSGGVGGVQRWHHRHRLFLDLCRNPRALQHRIQ